MTERERKRGSYAICTVLSLFTSDITSHTLLISLMALLSTAWQKHWD
jgi:hypothetical protein